MSPPYRRIRHLFPAVYDYEYPSIHQTFLLSPCKFPAFHLSGIFFLRMIGCHDLFRKFRNVLIFITHLHQFLQISQELFGIKRYRAADMNQMIRRGFQPLLCISFSSKSFSPGRSPTYSTLISTSGWCPDNLIRLRASVSIFTGSPISRTKISPPRA